MADDYYEILGVSRSANDDELRKAYFNLARKYHPDKNPDNPSAKAKFQEIQKAFETLSDPAKRKQYDQFGNAWEQMGEGKGGAPGWNSGDFSQFDFGDIFGGGAESSGGFGSFFDQLRKGASATGPRGKAAGRTRDVRQEVSIRFQTAVLGEELLLQLAEGAKSRELRVRIPAGVEDGNELRLKGQGMVGPRGAAGDLLLKIRVEDHPIYRRKGKDLELDLPITIGEAVNGGTVEFPSPRGTLAVRIPAGCSSGAKLRVKGQGVASKGETPGDLYAVVKIVIPKTIEESSKKAIEQFEAANPLTPRRDLHW